MSWSTFRGALFALAAPLTQVPRPAGKGTWRGKVKGLAALDLQFRRRIASALQKWRFYYRPRTIAVAEKPRHLGPAARNLCGDGPLPLAASLSADLQGASRTFINDQMGK